MLDDLELGVFAFGYDVIKVESAISLETGHILHDRVVRADWIGSDNVDVGEGTCNADGLTPANELLFGLLV